MSIQKDKEAILQEISDIGQWDTNDMAHRSGGLTVDANIINKAKWYQEGYEAGQRDERERIKQKERSNVEGKTE
jgi:hypothetical protein